jgi:hypothetical protein
MDPHHPMLASPRPPGQARTMSNAPPPAAPTIFAPVRRSATLARMAVRQSRADAARFLFDDIAEDVAERMAFLRHEPGRTLLLGDPAGVIGAALGALGAEVITSRFPLEQPWPLDGFATVITAFAQDSTNDLPGTLIHARRALAPGGLMLATMAGAGSLPALRQIMLAADGERPAARLHPQVDVRAGAQLLQRAGFADPVADSRSLAVRYRGLERLVADLRDHGLSSVLADGGPPLGKAALARARAAFADVADADGRVTERFELLTLSGWRKAG